jgi:tRNA modification GTPase
LWLTDAGDYVEPDASFTSERWIIRTKADLYPPMKVDSDQFLLSLNDPDDIQKLIQRLNDHIASNDHGSIFIARERHVAALTMALSHLTSVQNNQYHEVEFIAEDCRLALLALEKLIGAVTPDEILGSIFSTFCIGK